MASRLWHEKARKAERQCRDGGWNLHVGSYMEVTGIALVGHAGGKTAVFLAALVLSHSLAGPSVVTNGGMSGLFVHPFSASVSCACSTANPAFRSLLREICGDLRRDHCVRALLRLLPAEDLTAPRFRSGRRWSVRPRRNRCLARLSLLVKRIASRSTAGRSGWNRRAPGTAAPSVSPCLGRNRSESFLRSESSTQEKSNREGSTASAFRSLNVRQVGQAEVEILAKGLLSDSLVEVRVRGREDSDVDFPILGFAPELLVPDITKSIIINILRTTTTSARRRPMPLSREIWAPRRRSGPKRPFSGPRGDVRLRLDAPRPRTSLEAPRGFSSRRPNHARSCLGFEARPGQGRLEAGQLGSPQEG